MTRSRPVDSDAHRRGRSVEPISDRKLWGAEAYEKVLDRYCYSSRTDDIRQRPTKLSATANEGLQHTGKRGAMAHTLVSSSCLWL